MDKVIANIIHESITTSEDCTIVDQKNGKAYATGIIQDLEVKNRNGRKYLTADMSKELKGERITELTGAKQMDGEAGHPQTMELSRQSTVDPKNTCVRFDAIWLVGKDIHANFHATNTPYGQAFNLDLIEGCKPAFSLRALGSIERDSSGICVVRSPKIITWDYVIFPSHKRAYTSRLIDPKDAERPLHESAMGILTEGTYQEFYDRCLVKEGADYKGTIGNIVINTESTDYAKMESANVKSILEQFDIDYSKAVLTENYQNILAKTSSGDTVSIKLEQYLADEIMNYCNK